MPLDNGEVIRRLILNALDFLRKAISGFTTEPKYSVINFYAAVELVLKARLLEEHWTLVVAKQTTRRQFEDGDFISVTFEDGVKRLRDVVGASLSDDAFRSFDAIRKHRNKMVHFFHSGAFSPAELQGIAAEQLRAWYYLNQLLTVAWRRIFEPYGAEIEAIEKSLRGHRDYLQVKFTDLAGQLKELRGDGKIIARCKTCEFESATVEELSQDLFQSKCLVCGARHRWVVVACPACEAKVEFEGDGEPFKCPKCDETEEPQELAEQLNEEFHKPDEASLALTPANCSECEGYHTVIEHSGRYLCVNCLDVNDELQQCEWCSEYSTGDMADSYLTGCGICEGHAGWHRDD